MSLVNDMLRDLSQQQKHYQTEASLDAIALENSVSSGIEQQLFQNSRVGKKLPVIWLPSALVFMVVLAALLIAKPYFFVADKVQHDHTKLLTSISVESQQAHEPPIQEPSIQESPIQEPVHELAQTVSPPIMTESQQIITVSQPKITESQQLQIYDLLQEASRALTIERLTTPAHDNAYTYYQQILAIDAQNPAAVQGLRKIAERYLAMADEKLQALDIDSAERLVDRAASVVQDQTLFNLYREKIAQARIQSVVPVEAKVAGGDNTALAADQAANHVPANSASKISVSIQEPFVANNEPQHLSISPNAKWQDQKAVQEARLLIDKNNFSGAIQVLEHAIANAEKSSASTKMLLDIYCQQQLADEVKTLLARADYLTAPEQAYYGAQLALLTDQQDAAISLLETQQVNAEYYEQYRALLASLYHSSARYSEAVSHYRRLLNSFGDKPAYWLGFALALDALEQTPSALQAYKRLAEFRDLQNEVRTYIEQRIRELTSP